ncbi:MAG: hypothetical protein H6872_11450 [Methylobacteriaceae bacterium]|nr:hypothetical protein [Methylobacteriaceae bacterium]
MNDDTAVRRRAGPGDLARRLGARSRSRPREQGGAWRRETFRLPRLEARAKAREWFDLYPKAAYMTEIEFWRVCEDGDIEFTIRRLPSAD